MRIVHSLVLMTALIVMPSSTLLGQTHPIFSDDFESGNLMRWTPLSVFYIWDLAPGNNTGSSWTNAHTSFPISFERHAIYYVASGDYGRISLHTPEFAGLTIEIRKATDADHGPSSHGWVNASQAMGLGQAVFGQIQFQSDWWILNGSIGGGPADPFGDQTPHGFLAVEDPVASQVDGVLYFGTLGTANASHIDVLHTEVRYTHMDHPAHNEPNGAGGRLVLMQANADDPIHHLRFSHCWFHTVYSSMLKSIRTNNITVEYSAMSENRAESTGNHASVISLLCDQEWDIRWNYFRNVGGSGVICVYEQIDCNLSGELDLGEYRGRGIRVYGNVWYEDNSTIGDDQTLLNEPFDTGTLNGFLGANPGGSMPVIDSVAINNTVVGLRGGLFGKNGTGGRFHLPDASTKVWNNLFYNIDKVTNAAGEIDYNLYYDIDYAPTNQMGANAVTPSTGYTPFVSPASYDFRLTENTPAGTHPPAPYDLWPFTVDMFGVERGGNGQTWSIGAFQYQP